MYTYIWSKLVTVLGIKNQVLNKNNFKLSPFSLLFGKEGQFVVKKMKRKILKHDRKMHHHDITLYNFNISSQLAVQVILNVDFTADQWFFFFFVFIEVCFIQNICHSEEIMSIVYNFWNKSSLQELLKQLKLFFMFLLVLVQYFHLQLIFLKEIFFPSLQNIQMKKCEEWIYGRVLYVCYQFLITQYLIT